MCAGDKRAARSGLESCCKVHHPAWPPGLGGKPKTLDMVCVWLCGTWRRWAQVNRTAPCCKIYRSLVPHDQLFRTALGDVYRDGTVDAAMRIGVSRAFTGRISFSAKQRWRFSQTEKRRYGLQKGHGSRTPPKEKLTGTVTPPVVLPGNTKQSRRIREQRLYIQTKPTALFRFPDIAVGCFGIRFSRYRLHQRACFT